MKVVTRGAAALAVIAAATVIAAGQGTSWPPPLQTVSPDSPVLTPAESMAKIVMPPGYRLELVVSEPMVQDPIAVDFDPDGRMYVIEMVGYMQDRQNARLMGMKPTGNGRRESHAHVPMPRMTNTYMLASKHDPKEIIASVKNGLYAVSFGGGQVDITSGKYVFQCTEAYRIENGKIGAPVKGAMLIGNGPTDLHRVTMIGNDFALDPGIGTCGKNGQGVPVGVGQPTLRMDKITVGGTA